MPVVALRFLPRGGVKASCDKGRGWVVLSFGTARAGRWLDAPHPPKYPGRRRREDLARQSPQSKIAQNDYDDPNKPDRIVDVSLHPIAATRNGAETFSIYEINKHTPCGRGFCVTGKVPTDGPERLGGKPFC